MSRAFGVREIITAIRAQNKTIQEQLQELKLRDAAHKQEMAALGKDLEAAWANLVDQLVPSVDAAALDAASARLMLPTLASKVVFDAAAKDRAEQEAIIKRIESDQDYINRAGRMLEVTAKQRELDEFIEPLKTSVQELEKAPNFLRLFGCWYDSPKYTHGWWTLSYYRDWKHADDLVAAFGEKMKAKTFAELSNRYREDSANLNSLSEKRDDLQRRRNALQALQDNLARAQQSLQRLPERHLALARARTREHLQELEETERFKLCNSPTLELASKRISGVMAKSKYLEGLHQEMVVKPRQELAKMLTKNEGEIAKLQLPKKRFYEMPGEDFDRRFRDRRDSWNKRLTRYDNTRTQIIIYDRYDRYDPVSQFIWWDVMTDGRLDGNFIPDVYDHHSHYGNYQHTHHDDAVGAVAADSSSSSSLLDSTDVS